MNQITKKPNKKRTIDNRYVEDIEHENNHKMIYKEFFPQTHDFDKYVFVDNGKDNSKCTEFTKQMVYAKNNPQNK